MKNKIIFMICLFIMAIIALVYAIGNNKLDGMKKDLLYAEVVNNDSIKMYNTYITNEDITNFENENDPTVKGNVTIKENNVDVNRNYVYHIKTGELFIGNNKYIVDIAEDGVLLIYRNSKEKNNLYAQDKTILQGKNEKDANGNTVYVIDEYEKFKRLGDTAEGHENENYSNEQLRTYAKANISRYKTYSNNQFTEEDYKYIRFEMNEYYKGVDITEYNEQLMNVYRESFNPIALDISLKTIFLLDRKVQTGGNVTLVKGQYLVNGDFGKYTFTSYSASKGGFGIIVPSNTTLDLNGSILKQIYNSSLNSSSGTWENQYRIIRVTQGENIVIKNGTLVGDRSERGYSLYAELGMGIQIEAIDNLKNVTIRDMVFKYISGDGISVSKVTENNEYVYSKNINILNNYIYACSKLGIGVTKVDSLDIKNNVIYNIIGTRPAAAIDVEPSGLQVAIGKYSTRGGKTDYLNANVDNLNISNNILNNFKILIIEHSIDDVVLKNNRILGRMVLYLSNGVFDLDGNYIDNNKYLDKYTVKENGEPISSDFWFQDQALWNVNNDIYFGSESPASCIYGNFPYIFYDLARLKFATIRNNIFKIDNVYFNCGLMQTVNNTFGANSIVKFRTYENNNYYQTTQYSNYTGSEINELQNFSNRFVNFSNNYINYNGSYEYKYLKITKPSNKQVYWFEHDDSCDNVDSCDGIDLNNENKIVEFDPTGMEIELYNYTDYNTSNPLKTLIAHINVISKNKIKIGSTEYNLSSSSGDVYTYNNVKIGSNYYTLEITKDLKYYFDAKKIKTNTLIKVLLKNRDNSSEKYDSWQRVKIHVAISDSKSLEIANEFTNEELDDKIKAGLKKPISDADLRKNYIKEVCKTIIGKDITNCFDVYSNYYIFNKEHFHNSIDKVPKEYVTLKIKGKTTNPTKLESSDIDQNGSFTVVATYLGVTMEQKFSASGLLSTINEKKKDSSFLESTSINSNLIRERIKRIYILSSDEYNSESFRQTRDVVFKSGRKWNVGAYNNIEYIAGYEIDSLGLYDVYIAPNTTQSGVKIVANENSAYLFAYIGYNEYCSDKTVIYGIKNLDTSKVKDMSYMFYHFGQNSLETLDLGDNFNISKVENMSYMFAEMKSIYLKELMLGTKWTKFVSKDSIFTNFGNTNNKTKIYLSKNVSRDGVIIDTSLAEFSVDEITIRFNANGGKGNMENQTVKYNQDVKLTKNTYTKDGYTFKEWNTKSDGSGTKYIDEGNIKIISDITLYAQWKAKPLAEELQNKNYIIRNNYVLGFTIGESINSIKEKLNDSDITIAGVTTIIATGNEIKKGNDSYIVVIKGDLTGDGKVNSGDLLQMRKHMLEEITLKGAYKEAGLIESTNEIKSLDLLRLRQYLLGKYEFKY